MDYEVYEKMKEVLTRALTSAPPPFQGDLDNPVYLKIIETIRSFKADNYPEPE